jgi:hypothetical protein
MVINQRYAGLFLKFWETAAALSVMGLSGLLWFWGARFTVNALHFLWGLEGLAVWLVPIGFSIIQRIHWPSKKSQEWDLASFSAVSLFDWVTSTIGMTLWMAPLWGFAMVYPPVEWASIAVLVGCAVLSLPITFFPEWAFGKAWGHIVELWAIKES